MVTCYVRGLNQKVTDAWSVPQQNTQAKQRGYKMLKWMTGLRDHIKTYIFDPVVKY